MAETMNSAPETLSDREFLTRLSQQVENIGNEMSAFYAEWTIAHDQDRKQADHIDTMLHEVLRFIEEHRPALARATALLGRKWTGYKPGGKTT
jgi:hypothetical protein